MLRTTQIATLIFALCAISAPCLAAFALRDAPKDVFTPEIMVEGIEAKRFEKIEDGVIHSYVGPLSKVKKVRDFEKRMGKIRASAIEMNRKLLGIPADFKFHCYVAMTDRRPNDRSGNNMSTTSRIVDEKTYSLVSVYADHMVVGKVAPETTLIHEFNHAVLREYLGAEYQKTPRWFREGIALLSAGQRDRRIRVLLAGKLGQSLSSITKAANLVPMLINGIKDKHGFDDYAEDVLLLDFAQKQNPKALPEMVASLKAGVETQEAYAKALGMTWAESLSAGMNYARRTMYAIEGGHYLDFFKTMKRFRLIETFLKDEDDDNDAKAKADLAALITKADGAFKYSRKRLIKDQPYTSILWAYYRNRGLAAIGKAKEASTNLQKLLEHDNALGVETTMSALISRRIASYAYKAGDYDTCEEWLNRVDYGMSYSRTVGSFVLTYRGLLEEARAKAKADKNSQESED